MRDDAKSFDEALKEAQKLGYAEADPTADVGGFDTARKTAILGALASGKLVSTEKMHIEGITEIALDDVKCAQALGYQIKLIGHAEIKDGKTLAFVSPMAISNANPLGRIDGVFNGILVNANMVGEVMFYGPGAGKLPTASAVVADIVDVIAKRDFAPKPLGWTEAENSDVVDFEEYSCARLVITKDGGYVTEAMNEKDAKALLSKDGVVSVYRVL
jgi:homoserine dehydrogenase